MSILHERGSTHCTSPRVSRRKTEEVMTTGYKGVVRNLHIGRNKVVTRRDGAAPLAGNEKYQSTVVPPTEYNAVIKKNLAIF